MPELLALSAPGGLRLPHLAHDAIEVLVDAFFTSLINHCCFLLVDLPLGVIARLDRVLRSDTLLDLCC